ncbi:hypothetical protein [Streptomyces tendae]|uniref:hypothetical protein n=1 Tax=Streptomyces tendae TaxID=1932 RepID=UPI00371F664A
MVGVQQPSVGHVQVLGHTAGAWPLRTRVGYADRCDRLLLIRAGRLLAGADRGSLLEHTGCDTVEEAFLHLAKPPGAVGVRETGSPLRTRGTPADPLKNTHLPVGDGICSRSWARGRSNVGRPGQPSVGVSRKEGVGTAVDPGAPGPVIRERRTLPDDHSVGAVSGRGAGEVAGHAPARVVLPRPGRQDAPRPGSPNRPRRILLRSPSGAPRRNDGCRPPDHLGVVPDGRAGSRRVTVDRRRARGLSGCRGRARAGPSRPFTGVAALSVRSGCAVRCASSCVVRCALRVPGRCPEHRRSGPTHSPACLSVRLSVRRAVRVSVGTSARPPVRRPIPELRRIPEEGEPASIPVK